MRANFLTAVLALSLMTAAPATAHHSASMFDGEKTVNLTVTIKEFHWVNPHSWLLVSVPDPATGRDADWSIEAASPNMLGRNGWSRSSLKPGDRAQLVIHPLRNGDKGGSLVSASVNGQRVGNGGQY